VKNEESSHGSNSIFQPSDATGFQIVGDEAGNSIKLMRPEFETIGMDLIKLQPTKLPKRIIATSTTHLAFLAALNAEDKLIGLTNPEFVFNKAIKHAIQDGRVTSVGRDGALNYELIIDLKPDLILAYTIDGQVDNKLQALGLPVLYTNEFLEPTPLARAEWIIALGYLIGKEGEAKSFFAKVKENYENTRARQINDSLTVFCGASFQGTWHVPAGQSFVARYIQDAGGSYIWKDQKGRLSIPLSFEAVYAMANEATYWLDVGQFTSLKALRASDDRYAQFAAFKNQRIYNYTVRINEAGAYDIYESAVVRPDVVLKDIKNIFNQREDSEPYFYEKLR